ncbi:restriction endonuclease [Streptomyces sp. NPDC000229]|uniref:restriction endonuclease n=1 Tax=Streptomyces sp. NPDC000229 TaxID=3154247 RepID=UPI00332D572D
MPRDTGEWLAAAVVAVAVAGLLAQSAVAAWTAAVQAWPTLAVLVGAGVLCAAGRTVGSARAARARAANLARLRLTLGEVDAMSDAQFEFALRDLLVRDGWTARRVGRQGDQAADVIGRHPETGRIVIQAKHTKVRGKVGSQVMYQVKGTAGPVHGADVAVVVTNGGFTRDAKRWGEQHQVHWIDRDRLRTWAEAGTPLRDLLGLHRRTRRSSPLRISRAVIRR